MARHMSYEQEDLVFVKGKLLRIVQDLSNLALNFIYGWQISIAREVPIHLPAFLFWALLLAPARSYPEPIGLIA